MIHTPFTRIFVLGAMIMAALAPALRAQQPAPWDGQTVAQRVENIRSITYYPYPSAWKDFDLQRYTKALDDMKQAGCNTVWLVIPWYEFQSQALPKVHWIAGARANLKVAVAVAEEKKMNVILPLCYLGETWAPQGIDARIWTLDDAMYGAFEDYVASQLEYLQAFHNIIYLLYTEDCHPYPRWARELPLAIASYRQWCKSVNPDIAHWNERWGTSFTWETLVPRPRGAKPEADADFWRWSASILRERHGGLARKMKAITGPQALVGYHDWNIMSANYSQGDTPMPVQDNPYDLMSMNSYHLWSPNKDRLALYEANLHTIANRFRAMHPGLPLAMLECGAATYQVGFDEQAQTIEAITRVAREERIGINIWMWQDFMGKANSLSECSFGFLGPDGGHKPSYDALIRAWAPQKIEP